jgi:hypothetical protein
VKPVHPIAHEKLDQGLPTVAALAMNVLEQVKRGGPSAIKCVEVGCFQLELRRLAQMLQKSAYPVEVLFA